MLDDIVHTSLWQTRAGPEETIGLGHEPPNDRNRRPDRSTSTARTPGTVGSPEYKNGTSMAAPEPKVRLGGSGSRRAGRRGSGVIPGQTQAYTAL
jgi:hypothetical protein